MDDRRKQALEKISSGLESGKDISAIMNEPIQAMPKRKKQKVELKAICISLTHEDFINIRKISDFLWEKDQISNAKTSHIIRAALNSVELSDQLRESYKKC